MQTNSRGREVAHAKNGGRVARTGAGAVWRWEEVGKDASVVVCLVP